MPSKTVCDTAVNRKAKVNFHVTGDLFFSRLQVLYLNKNCIIFQVLHQASFQRHDMFVAVVTLISHIQQSSFSYYWVQEIKKVYPGRDIQWRNICNECKICVTFKCTDSKQSLSHYRLSSDVRVRYTLENVWARQWRDGSVNFIECLSSTVRLYITQNLKVIGITRLPTVTCPYCWRDYTSGGDVHFDI